MTAGPSSTADSNLESLSLTGASGGISFTGCPGVAGVEEYLTQTTTLNAGNSYAVTIHFGTCGGNYAGVGEVWIDFNQNYVFEPSESILTWAGTPPGAPAAYIFNVPAASMNGLTRMRVMHAEGQSLPLDPCASFTWGSVTDFNVVIANGVDCSGYVGDDMSDPRIVGALPYSETHNSGFCYTNQNPAYNSTDVFYLVTPNGLNSVDVSLCGSSFDTFLTVKDKNGNVIALNDDHPDCGGTASKLTVETTGLDSIYVIVEGWGIEMGDYTISIMEGSLNTLSLEGNDPFMVYPNPTSTSFKISGGFEGTLRIINSEGRLIKERNVSNKENIDVSNLTPGFYLLQLENESRVYDKKLIIE
jgi:hypothetical protein